MKGFLMKSTIPLSVIALLVLTGCAPKSITHQVSSQEYISPEKGTTNTAYMGDPIIKSATGYKLK